MRKITIKNNYDTHDWQKYNGLDFHRKKGDNKRYFCYSKECMMHVYVWETVNHRKKPDGFVIHHLDQNKSHNNISNLVLWTDEEHRIWHAKNDEKRKKNISKAMKGKSLTEDHKAKIRKTLIGVRHTEERKRNISKSLLGKTFTIERMKNLSKGIVINMETKKEYYSAAEAKRQTGINHINSSCKTGNKAGGYQWKYKEVN